MPTLGADRRAKALTRIDDSAGPFAAAHARGHAADTTEVVTGQHCHAAQIVATVPTARARLSHSDSPSRIVQGMTPVVSMQFHMWRVA